MGLPSVNVNFITTASTLSQRSERGIVGMIIKGIKPAKNPLVVKSEQDIPKSFSAENREQILFALKGYVNTPKRVEVFCLASDAENYTEALNYYEVSKINYLVAPTCETDNQKDALATWVQEQRKNKKEVKIVLPNQAADHVGIINYTTESVTIGEKTFNAEKFCSRIAGILAGTPASISCTFAPIEEATDCTRLSRTQLDTEIDSGHFVVFHDGEKVKVGRGVNSLVTPKDNQNEQYKKIKIIECMDMINDDLIKLIEENYIGKLPNSYDNKCLVISAIMDYFDELSKQSILSSYEVGIDIQANKSYLESKGIKTDDMTADELKKADTGEKVYIYSVIRILDAMEDITININV